MLNNKMQPILFWIQTRIRALWSMGDALLHDGFEFLRNRRRFHPIYGINPYNLWLFLGILIAVLWVWGSSFQPSRMVISYGNFLQHLDQGDLSDLLISPDQITGLMGSNDERKTPFITYPLQNPDLARLLAEKGLEFSVERVGARDGMSDLVYLTPTLLILLLFLFGALRWGSFGSGVFRSHRRTLPIILDSSNRIRFKDVAGTQEAKQELEETITFLKDPKQIERLGGRIPKGVLLVGAPGTGKTLLARAVAGEAGVPFFNISGSEFIEMFVGVGAARVRELFDQAREHAPCMIFIDELDAIGRSRAAPQWFGGHDEREQTLNQLLTEMDGFDPSVGVVVMAATNRPEILDRALLRSGRFDRQIVVDRPGMKDRLEILALHVHRLVLDSDINLPVVAQRTAGLVGADLANICNEAAILAVRDHAERVAMRHLEAAIDRVLAGPEKRSLVLTLDEKERVACHEAGHALVAALLPHAQLIHKVSIIPRGSGVLGYTLQLPFEERFLSTESELQDQLSVLMAGRKSEHLKYGNYSSGAKNDLETATALARKMVCEWGMSLNLGPVALGKWQRLRYLGAEGTEERNYSDQTAQRIDQEIKALLSEAEHSAGDLLKMHRKALDEIMTILTRQEVLDGETIRDLVKREFDALAP